jgi:hypothetical protein
MGQMWQYVIFLSLKLTKVTSDFILNYIVEKSCRGCHHTEILKTNTKTLIYSIWINPQGSLGCQKIAPKLKDIQNAPRKQGFLTFFFSILTFFQSLCLFGAILAQKLNSFVCKKII